MLKYTKTHVRDCENKKIFQGGRKEGLRGGEGGRGERKGKEGKVLSSPSEIFLIRALFPCNIC